MPIEPDEPGGEARLTPDDLPRLAVFLAGYFGEGAPRSARSAAEAAYDYAAEAELDELEELARDWDQLRAIARALPLDRVREALRTRFGSSWQPLDTAELDAVAHEFERALRE